MNTTTCTHKDNPNFWIFGLFFFLYFFIMATCFPFLPIWLSDIIGLNKTHTGIVFSCISLSAIAFQPVLGVISDKLGLKKHLLWIIAVLLFLFAPFFLFIFAPLLKANISPTAERAEPDIGFQQRREDVKEKGRNQHQQHGHYPHQVLFQPELIGNHAQDGLKTDSEQRQA